MPATSLSGIESLPSPASRSHSLMVFLPGVPGLLQNAATGIPLSTQSARSLSLSSLV